MLFDVSDITKNSTAMNPNILENIILIYRPFYTFYFLFYLLIVQFLFLKINKLSLEFVRRFNKKLIFNKFAKFMASEALILFIPFVVICIIMRNINAVERNTLIPVLTISLIWLYHYIPLIVNRVTNNFFFTYLGLPTIFNFNFLEISFNIRENNL